MDELIELVREGRHRSEGDHLAPAAAVARRPKGYELFDSKEALKVVLDPEGLSSTVSEEERCSKGLMQDDYQLTIQHMLDRMRGPCYGDSEVVTLQPTTATDARVATAEVGERVDRLCRALEQLGIEAGRPRRHVRVELAGAPRALHGRAVHGRGAAHAQHPPLPRAAHLHRQPRRGQGRSSSTTRSCRCSRRSRRPSRPSSTT